MQGQQSASSSLAAPLPIRGPFSHDPAQLPQARYPHPHTVNTSQSPQLHHLTQDSYRRAPVASTSTAPPPPPPTTHSLSPDWTAAQIGAGKNSIVHLLQNVAATGGSCKFFWPLSCTTETVASEMEGCLLLTRTVLLTFVLLLYPRFVKDLLY